MASQIVSVARRYRLSLLLDAYGELLTEKQRTFLRHYFEEDRSFGEIAREYGVSRQAIFDAVKHGEEALEHFERILKLVDSGWGAWREGGLTPEAVAQRLAALRERVGADGQAGEKARLHSELGELIAALRGPAEADAAAEGEEPSDHV